MTVNLKLLTVFLLVAERGSFRQAAEEADRSQSAVSMQIRQLERQLGVALFHRTTRRVTLTNEGEELLTCARRALAELEQGFRRIRETVEVQRGRVLISCAPTIAATRLPLILAAFKEEHPQIVVHVREEASAQLLESIRRQEVDFGIGPRVNKGTEFHFHSILEDEIWALLPSDYNVSSRSAITLAELALMPTLMLTKSAALRADLDRALAEQHVTLDSKYEGMQVQTMIAMVAAGLGAAILPRVAVPARDSSRFHALPVDPPMSRDICIITLAGQQLSPAAAQFANILERTLSRPGATVLGARRRTRRAQAG